MLKLLTFFAKLILILFQSRKSLVIKNALLQKELEILKRKSKNQVKTKKSDRVIISILNLLNNIKDSISIVKPETILKWQRTLIKRFWTFERKSKPGRPPVPSKIKHLILTIKNANLTCGSKRIQGELTKLTIYLDPTTIWNILTIFIIIKP